MVVKLGWRMVVLRGHHLAEKMAGWMGIGKVV
jgi:hypothetical protein